MKCPTLRVQQKKYRCYPQGQGEKGGCDMKKTVCGFSVHGFYIPVMIKYQIRSWLSVIERAAY